MFEDPLVTCAVLAAIYIAGCVACFFVGRYYERNRRRQVRPDVLDPVSPTPVFRREFQPPRL